MLWTYTKNNYYNTSCQYPNISIPIELITTNNYFIDGFSIWFVLNVLCNQTILVNSCSVKSVPSTTENNMYTIVFTILLKLGFIFMLTAMVALAMASEIYTNMV